MERRSRDERMAGGAGAGPRGPPGRPLPPPPSFPQSRGPPPPPPRRFEPVDREKTCPLLLRVFTKNGGHHTQEDFAVRGKEPKDEVKEIAPAARRRNAKLSFAFVYPDKRGCYVFKQAGMTHAHGNIGRRLDDSKSLNELKFQIGDYLDVAVL
ncbi:PREDICTED: histone deacetylase complex subunit SAP18-like isoform 2 [Fragaria vesca subsp. vesca]